MHLWHVTLPYVANLVCNRRFWWASIYDRKWTVSSNSGFLTGIILFKQHCIQKLWIVVGFCLGCIVILHTFAILIYCEYKFLLKYRCLIMRNVKTQDITNGYLYNAYFAYRQLDYAEVIKIFEYLHAQNFKIGSHFVSSRTWQCWKYIRRYWWK